jgi:hypothetical protein
MKHYNNNVDFYSMFEADTFDIEEHNGRVFKGYIYDEDGEQVLVAEFTHYDDSTYGGGEGWYNNELI